MAQLVLPFMTDPVAGVTEMAPRDPTRKAVVAASVWDHAGGHGPLSAVLGGASPSSIRELEGEARAGRVRREGHLAELFRAAGLRRPRGHERSWVGVEHPTFEEWWEPFTLGVGTVGSFMTTRSPEEMVALREACRAILPPAPFTLKARAWTVVARV